LSIKKLASHTLYYGLSSIAAKFINYLLTPYLTYNAAVSIADYGKMTAMYAIIPIINIVFTYGMETAYFRFIQQEGTSEKVNSTASISIISSTIILTLIGWFFAGPIATIASLQGFENWVQISLLIIALDALSAIPFARLRNEGRPLLFAFIRIASILLNVGLTLFFLSYCPKQVAAQPNSWYIIVYDPEVNPVTYILIANLAQSAFTFLLLSKWLLPKQWHFDIALWQKMMAYALPMLLAGMGGMINETFDRLMLGWWLPAGSDFDAERGIYGACYKLSLLITLFIQAFRMGAEPFFFKQAQGANPQIIYARVMKFFVITLCFIFLGVTLYMPLLKYFIGEKYWAGLSIVPLLLLANMALGIYYNLSVWYKVTSNTMAGAYITLAGVAITFAINYVFIPTYGYIACAWATFLCYTSMMVISFRWGQKHYYIPYKWKKLLAYIVIVLLLFGIQSIVAWFVGNLSLQMLTATLLFGIFTWFITLVERKELKQLPVLGRFIR